MLILGRADLERLLAPAEVIDALDQAFRGYAEGRATVPPRAVTEIATGSLLLVMPAVVRGGEAGGGGVGTKLITYYADNRARGLPTLYATYVLMDGDSGRPLAVLEGTFLTALRTGATSALAARHLARPDARRVACFGAGVQAGFQLRCLAAVRPLAHVDVIGRDPQRAAAFAHGMARTLGIPVVVADDPRDAVSRADIVTCATTSATPVVFGRDLVAGTHVDAVGAFRSGTREVDTETVRRARVVVDTYAGALEEAGDVLIPMSEGAIDRSHLAAELAEVVSGARAGRQAPEEVTLFKSVGCALEDLATARLAWDRAREHRIGVDVDL